MENSVTGVTNAAKPRSKPRSKKRISPPVGSRTGGNSPKPDSPVLRKNDKPTIEMLNDYETALKAGDPFAVTGKDPERDYGWVPEAHYGAYKGRAFTPSLQGQEGGGGQKLNYGLGIGHPMEHDLARGDVIRLGSSILVDRPIEYRRIEDADLARRNAIQEGVHQGEIADVREKVQAQFGGRANVEMSMDVDVDEMHQAEYYKGKEVARKVYSFPHNPLGK